MNQPSERILIVGAGIAGPTLAYWLRRYGFIPTLIEHAPKPRTSGYMIDFWGIGYDVADRMDMAQLLELDGYRIDEVRLVDERGNRISGFEAQIFRDATGGRFLTLPRSDLAERLYQRVEGIIETCFGETVRSISENAHGVSVTFARASPRQFDLVIGADGLHSTVRNLAFESSAVFERYLGYYTAAFTTAGYRHRTDDAYVCYSIPGGQIARYALRGGRSAFFFMFVEPNQFAVAHTDTGAQKRVLHERFAGRGWECDEILQAMDGANDLYFDRVSQIRMPQWSRGRVALAGDAAHAPSLLAGQGAALAMAGAYVLANALHRSSGDHDIAFADYERQFKPFVDAKQRAATRLGWWFAPKTKFGMRLRNLTMNLFAVPPIARGLVRRGFADRFELPA